jgi:hypothetical protein
MSCPTCYGKGWVPEHTTAASSHMAPAGMGRRVCATCGGSGKHPNAAMGAAATGAPAGRGGFYDTLVNFECFVIGVIGAILLWQFHAVAGIIGLIAGWLGGLMLFGLFPKIFTGVFTVIWVAIAIGIAESLSGGDWVWSTFAAIVAAAGSISAHMRTLRTLRDAQ